MAEILSIRGEPLEQKEGHVEQLVVDILEEFLAMAKRGEVVTLSLVGAGPNNDISTRMHAPGNSCYLLLGGMDFLRARIVNMMERNAR